MTDRKLAIDEGDYDPATGTYTTMTPDGDVDYYIADVVSQSDYYPFGMMMPGRNDNTPEYRYGYNGMEKDDEVTEQSGTSYDFGARFYNPRVGRWLSVDPVSRKQPGWSPYKAMFDNPMVYSDPDGKTEYLKTIIYYEKTGETIEITRFVSDDVMASHVYSDGTVHYSDYTRTETYTITEDGMYYEKGDSYSVGEKRITLPAFLPKVAAELLLADLEGDGEKQAGGYQLTTKSGGVSSTRTIAENDVETRDIGDLLTALSALGKSGKINVPGSYFKKMKVELPDRYSQFTYDAFKKIMNIVKKTDLKPSPTDNNGNTAPPATTITKTGGTVDGNSDAPESSGTIGSSSKMTTTSTGDINNQQPGDTLTTTENNGQDTIKVDVNTDKKNAGGGWIKERIQTGNKK